MDTKRQDRFPFKRSLFRVGGATATVLTLLAALTLPLVATVGPLASSASATGPTCNDFWTATSGGSWDTPGNWSAGEPTSSSVVCITAAGSYTVTIGNETINVADLTVGGTGSTPTLVIGTTGSGLANITIPGTTTIATGSTLEFGFEGSFTAGTITNSGTFLIPTSPYNSSLTATTFTNAGTFSVDYNLALTLPTAGVSFTNTGTISVAKNVDLAVSSPSGVVATVAQSGVIDNSGSLTVADELSISGGSICGDAPYVGSGDGGTGGTLAFASTVSSGPSCGTGVATDSLFVPNVTATISGTIPATYTVSVGDGGPTFPNVTLSSVTNKGTLSFGWGGTLTGALTNSGTFVVPASTYTSTFNTTGITNSGTFTVDASLNLSLTASGATFSNSSASRLTVSQGATFNVASPVTVTATFIQGGLFTNNGSASVTDTLQINGGSICGNAVNSGSGDGGTGGTLAFAATLGAGKTCATGLAVDHVFIPNVTGTITTNIPAGWTVIVGDGGPSYAHITFDGTVNAGTFDPGYGATITDTNSVTNDGTFDVPPSGYTTALNLGGLTNNGSMTFDGATTLTAPLFTDDKKKEVIFGPGATTSLSGNVSDSGTFVIAAGGFVTVGGTYAQVPSGIFAVQIGSSVSSPRLQVHGAATLAGVVDVLTHDFTPSVGEQFTLLQGSPASGTFSKVLGSFAISYTSTSVIATAN